MSPAMPSHPVTFTTARPSRSRSLRGLAAVIAVAVVALGGGIWRPAAASPIDDKRAQADQLSRQIDALGNQESALAEKYNQAVLARQAVEQKAVAAQGKLDAAKAQATAVRRQVREVAVDSYVD